MADGRSLPVPPFPSWTGVRAHLGPPRQQGTHLTVVVTVPTITRRARLWLAWHHLAKGDRRAAPLG